MKFNASAVNQVWGTHKTWFLVRTPSRPAAWQLAVIRERLREIRIDGEVAILGSTPEFQDLLSEFEKIQIKIIDRSTDFSKQMGHQRRRNDRTDVISSLIVGDWTEVLEGMPGRFSAILSDLTSGNIPYAARDRHYKAIHSALRNGGVFADRVLTLESPLVSRKSIYAEFGQRPISLESVNELNCRLLFTSDVASGTEELKIAKILQTARNEWTSDIGQAYLEALTLITPSNGIWWYGRSWSELRNEHVPLLQEIDNIPEPIGSIYNGFARLIIKRRHDADLITNRDSNKNAVLRCQIAALRSHAAAVLEESKQLMESLPLPDGNLGTAFLQRVVEKAVVFRDDCHRFKMERIRIDTRHWGFMESLFEQIVGLSGLRAKTYAFCWRYQRTDVLFSSSSPEWKSLFVKAIELAAESKITLRALMVTEDEDSERMKALERLQTSIGKNFQIAYIRTADFESTMASDALSQYKDFGVFGEKAAFLTLEYEPTVVGEYLWAREQVSRLHHLFDRMWEQASKAPKKSSRNIRPLKSWKKKFADLVKVDLKVPVSCVAQIESHGGGAFHLNKKDLQKAFTFCADICTKVEILLRDCIEAALIQSSSDALGAEKLKKFVERSTNGNSPRQAVKRKSIIRECSDIRNQLDKMYFMQEWEFVEKNWQEFNPPLVQGEMRELVKLVNKRPHAHANEALDLAELVVYRDAGRSLEIHFSKWRESMDKIRTVKVCP